MELSQKITHVTNCNVNVVSVQPHGMHSKGDIWMVKINVNTSGLK